MRFLNRIVWIVIFVLLFIDADESLVRPYLNQGTKTLEKKYPWLYEKMEDILMNKKNIEAYLLESAYFKRLGDLNGDGIDELYLHSNSRCGASICNYRVYEIDVKNRTLREIFDAYNDSETTKIGNKLSSGWRTISIKQCWGASDCHDYTFLYDADKKHYINADNVICNDDTMSNAVYSNCIIDNSIILEERLNHTYQKFLDSQDDKIYRQKIEKSQIIWKKYRKAQLDMAFPHADNPKYFWTGFNACFYSYKNKLTCKRIEEIKGWKKWIELSGCKSFDTTK